MKKTKIHHIPTCPYTFPHKSRAAKVDYICSIGGYYADRHTSFPIEFNVAAYACDLSFETIWEKYVEDEWRTGLGMNPEECAAYYKLAKSLHTQHADSLWLWGQEDAARTLSDGDAYKMLWDGTPVEVTLGLYGRQGKHLVIEHFEGRTLAGLNTEALQDLLMQQNRPDGYEHVEYATLRTGNEWEVSTKYVDTLYRYVRQCEVDFTQQKASEEIEYQGAFQFFANIVAPAWDDYKKNRADHEAVVACSQLLYQYFVKRAEGSAIFRVLATLSEAAGVTDAEMKAPN